MPPPPQKCKQIRYGASFFKIPWARDYFSPNFLTFFQFQPIVLLQREHLGEVEVDRLASGKLV